MASSPPDPNPSRKLKILCLHGFRQSAPNFSGRLASLRKRLKHIADLVFIDGPHCLPAISTTTATHSSSIENKTEYGTQARPRRAWLLTEEQAAALYQNNDGNEAALMMTTEFATDQHQQQTVGWEASLQVIEEAIKSEGPFDGVLGFSQGASIAGTLCALQPHNSSQWFRFAIICSGYISAVPQHRQLLLEYKNSNNTSTTSNKIHLPSLHIYSDSNEDRQITSIESIQLAECFNDSKKQLIPHPNGHVVPGNRATAERIKAFLADFL